MFFAKLYKIIDTDARVGEKLGLWFEFNINRGKTSKRLAAMHVLQPRRNTYFSLQRLCQREVLCPQRTIEHLFERTLYYVVWPLMAADLPVKVSLTGLYIG